MGISLHPRLIGQSQLKDQKWISYPLIQTLETNHEQRSVDSSMVAHVKNTR